MFVCLFAKNLDWNFFTIQYVFNRINEDWYLRNAGQFLFLFLVRVHHHHDHHDHHNQSILYNMNGDDFRTKKKVVFIIAVVVVVEMQPIGILCMYVCVFGKDPIKIENKAHPFLSIFVLLLFFPVICHMYVLLE